MQPTSVELRNFPRIDISCPITLINSYGQFLKAITVNVSDGGALVEMTDSPAPEIGEVVDVDMLVPLSLGQTQRYRKIRCMAKVSRHQTIGANKNVRVAIQFQHPLKLGFNVNDRV
jgi:hypothetical protein